MYGRVRRARCRVRRAFHSVSALGLIHLPANACTLCFTFLTFALRNAQTFRLQFLGTVADACLPNDFRQLRVEIPTGAGGRIQVAMPLYSGLPYGIELVDGAE